MAIAQQEEWLPSPSKGFVRRKRDVMIPSHWNFTDPVFKKSKADEFVTAWGDGIHQAMTVAEEINSWEGPGSGLYAGNDMLWESQRQTELISNKTETIYITANSIASALKMWRIQSPHKEMVMIHLFHHLWPLLHPARTFEVTEERDAEKSKSTSVYVSFNLISEEDILAGTIGPGTNARYSINIMYQQHSIPADEYDTALGKIIMVATGLEHRQYEYGLSR